MEEETADKLEGAIRYRIVPSESSAWEPRQQELGGCLVGLLYSLKMCKSVYIAHLCDFTEAKQTKASEKFKRRNILMLL